MSGTLMLPFTFKHNPWVNRFTVLQMIQAEPKTAIDLGCGDGFYGILFYTFATECVTTGVDANPEWIDRAISLGTYHYVACADITISEFGPFDMTILGDVLEHLDYDDAVDVLKNRVANSKWVIVNGPVGFEEQPHENPLEWHRCGITREFFKAYDIVEYRESPDNRMMNCLIKGRL